MYVCIWSIEGKDIFKASLCLRTFCYESYEKNKHSILLLIWPTESPEDEK